jgi:hypothetical protein
VLQASDLAAMAIRGTEVPWHHKKSAQAKLSCITLSKRAYPQALDLICQEMVIG